MAKLVECVPNFSVSREKDPAVFQGLFPQRPRHYGAHS